VVVLGGTGRNFAGGMSGGIAYVFDEHGDFTARCNTAMVAIEPVLTHKEQEAQVERAIWHSLGGSPAAGPNSDERLLRELLERHFRYTGSFRAKEILADWDNARLRFRKVFPHEYRRALRQMAGEPVAARMAA
jgi:glutamate synthase domain-containing protein 3